MSEYMVCKTEFSDLTTLEETLAQFGIPKDALRTTGGHLHGWHSSITADIIIPKIIAHSSHDIGLRKTSNGSYEVLVYDMDHGGLAADIQSGKLTQCYAKNKIMKVVQQHFDTSRIEQEETQEDGRISISVDLGF